MVHKFCVARVDVSEIREDGIKCLEVLYHFRKTAIHTRERIEQS